MRNLLWLTVVAHGLCAGSIQAQGFLPGGGGYNPANQPAVSPYLNLLRRDAPEYLNYFGMVRPQLDFGGAIQQLQTGQAYANAEQTSFQKMILTLPATGHKASFMSHLRYFNTNGMGGGLGMPGMGGMGGGLGMPGMGGMGGGLGMPGMGGMGMPGAQSYGTPAAPR